MSSRISKKDKILEKESLVLLLSDDRCFGSFVKVPDFFYIRLWVFFLFIFIFIFPSYHGISTAVKSPVQVEQCTEWSDVLSSEYCARSDNCIQNSRWIMSMWEYIFVCLLSLKIFFSFFFFLIFSRLTYCSHANVYTMYTCMYIYIYTLFSNNQLRWGASGF